MNSNLKIIYFKYLLFLTSQYTFFGYRPIFVRYVFQNKFYKTD